MPKPSDEYEVVWHGAAVSAWGEKGSLLSPEGYCGGSTWELVEDALSKRPVLCRDKRPAQEQRLLDAELLDELVARLW